MPKLKPEGKQSRNNLLLAVYELSWFRDLWFLLWNVESFTGLPNGWMNSVKCVCFVSSNMARLNVFIIYLTNRYEDVPPRKCFKIHCYQVGANSGGYRWSSRAVIFVVLVRITACLWAKKPRNYCCDSPPPCICSSLGRLKNQNADWERNWCRYENSIERICFALT